MSEFHEGVVVVTGGGSGIGRGAAVALTAKGVPVALADVDTVGLDQTIALIAEVGGRATALTIDVTEPDSIEAGFAEAEAWGGPVTGLINSAGILRVEAYDALSPSDFSQVMDINVRGSFLCAQRAFPGMKEAGYGRVVNLSSVSGFRAGIGRAAYGTSKSAIIGLTRQMALEFGRHGITANAVAPGATVTAMTREAYTEETRTSLLPMIPAGRLGEVEDIVPAILFLMSQAAGYINGHTLPVDGGYLASGMLQTGGLSG